MKHILSILSFLILISTIGTCSSCRAVQKSSASIDSLAISKMEMTSDAAAEEELKRIIEKLREDFVFTIRETTTLKDSAGNIKEHVHEKIMRHTKECRNDSLSQKCDTSAHVEKADSTATYIKVGADEVVKEANNFHIIFAYIIIVGIIIIVIVLLITYYRKRLKGF